MPTLADLIQELRELGVALSEIHIPYSWYRQIIRHAEELADSEQDDESDW